MSIELINHETSETQFLGSKQFYGSCEDRFGNNFGEFNDQHIIIGKSKSMNDSLNDSVKSVCSHYWGLSQEYYDAYMEQQRSQTNSKRIAIDEKVSVIMGLTIGIFSTLSFLIISLVFCRSQPNDSDELK